MAYDCNFTSDMVNSSKLLKLKFTQAEIAYLSKFIDAYGQVTAAKAIKLTGINEGSAKKLKYMYDICTGAVTTESPDDLAKHFRKMAGGQRRLGIQDLAVSKIQRVPRKAVIAGIPEGTFSIYNSNRYNENERMYNVIDVTGSNIIIRTDRKPILKYGASRKLDDIIEIREVNADGTVDIAINKANARLCNRFIVVASLRRPEFHHGMVEMIAIEGTKVYVFNQTMGGGEIPSYKNGTQRVYDYGFTSKELCPKLMASAKSIFNYIKGVYSCVDKPNSDFTLIKRVEVEEPEEIQID